MQIRIIPDLEKRENVVEMTQKPFGKLLVLITFGALWTLCSNWDSIDTAIELVVILTALTFFPQHRRLLVFFGTFYWLMSHTINLKILQIIANQHEEGLIEVIKTPYFYIAIVALVVIFCIVFYKLAETFPRTWPMNRPVATLITGYFLLMCIAYYVPMNGMLSVWTWGFILVLGKYLWFLGYSLLDRGSKKATSIVSQFGFYLPFWGSSYTPFPKGAAYLRKIEADTAEKLAISQIKGIKLVAWAIVLSVFRYAVDVLIFGNTEGYLPGLLEQEFGMVISLGLPDYQETYRALFAGQTYGLYIAWASILLTFFRTALDLAIWGHLIIATCRMSGFCALRNTHKPFTSISLYEFWNRYYYYFKELLVDFFFYPCYMRYFKKYPRLRRPLATLSAAGFGNVLYHYLRDIKEIMRTGPWDALVSMQSYMFYGLVLGTSIVISQRYSEYRPPATRGRMSHILGPIWVFMFFAVLHVFDGPRSQTLSSNFSFFFSLFGIT